MSLIPACIALTSTLSEMIPIRLNEMTQHLEYLKDLTQFCQFEESQGALSARSNKDFTFEKIEFKNVSFSYPGTGKLVLNHVSFTIRPGRQYAFVGENGAGKTTVIKLLTGQYLNYEGEIFLNNRELKDYATFELKAFFNVVYQDFAKYEISLKENILLGNLEERDENRLQEVIKALELEELVSNLPKGLDTQLGKVSEDGVDLSDGQWQRIALARMVINPTSIKILDEPTAALDPLSESHLYKQFEKLIRGQTSIFISHRLGSIKLADEIFFFDKGTLIEQGTHEGLMIRKAKYAQMYRKQLEWYIQGGGMS